MILLGFERQHFVYPGEAGQNDSHDHITHLVKDGQSRYGSVTYGNTRWQANRDPPCLFEGKSRAPDHVSSRHHGLWTPRDSGKQLWQKLVRIDNVRSCFRLLFGKQCAIKLWLDFRSRQSQMVLMAMA